MVFLSGAVKNADLEIERMLAGLGLVSYCVLVVFLCLTSLVLTSESCPVLSCLVASLLVFYLADAIGNRGGGGKFNALPQVSVR